MFLTKEQLDRRLQSPSNVLNIIKRDNNASLSPSEISVPLQHHPPVPYNLPNETDRQRAARTARRNIDYHEKHGEYTVNPNIDNDIVRATIGILSANNTSKEIQSEFNITKNQIVGIKNSNRKSISQRIEAGKNKVSELAVDKLMGVLGLLDLDEVARESPKDIASIAVSMSKVVSSIDTSKDRDKGAAKVNLTVVAPSARDISQYRTIDV